MAMSKDAKEQSDLENMVESDLIHICGACKEPYDKSAYDGFCSYDCLLMFNLE